MPSSITARADDVYEGNGTTAELTQDHAVKDRREFVKLETMHEAINEAFILLREYLSRELSDSKLQPQEREEMDTRVMTKVQTQLPSLISLFEAEKTKAVNNALTDLQVDYDSVLVELRAKSKELVDVSIKMQEMETKIGHLVMEVNTLRSTRETIEDIDLVGSETLNEGIEDDPDDVQQENAILRRDNNSLRAHLASILKPPGQLREDACYLRPLNTLNQAIQGWVPKVFRTYNSEELPEKSKAHLLQVFNNSHYDPYGKSTASFLSNRPLLDNILQNPRKRMVLVRHIIALHLWRDVFEPFTFGHDHREVEKDIFQRHSKALNDPTNCRTQLW